MLPSLKGTALLAQVVYLPGQSKKKKAMQAMLAMAWVLRSEDVVAMSMAVWRILSAIGRMQFGAGSAVVKPQRRWLRQKSMVPRVLRHGSRAPSRANIWPTEWRAFSTIQDWTGWLQGSRLVVDSKDTKEVGGVDGVIHEVGVPVDAVAENVQSIQCQLAVRTQGGMIPVWVTAAAVWRSEWKLFHWVGSRVSSHVSVDRRG